MQGQDLDACGVLRVAGDDHAALAGYQVLGDVETEAPEVPEGARPPTVVLRLNRVGAILDDGKATRRSDLRDRVHVAWPPGEVDRHDRPGPRREARPHLIRVHV